MPWPPAPTRPGARTGYDWRHAVDDGEDRGGDTAAIILAPELQEGTCFLILLPQRVYTCAAQADRKITRRVDFNYECVGERSAYCSGIDIGAIGRRTRSFEATPVAIKLLADLLPHKAFRVALPRIGTRAHRRPSFPG